MEDEKTDDLMQQAHQDGSRRGHVPTTLRKKSLCMIGPGSDPNFKIKKSAAVKRVLPSDERITPDVSLSSPNKHVRSLICSFLA